MRIGRRLETGRRSESCIYKLMFYLFVHTFMKSVDADLRSECRFEFRR
jgi:hypothetical protein